MINIIAVLTVMGIILGVIIGYFVSFHENNTLIDHVIHGAVGGGLVSLFSILIAGIINLISSF